MTFDELPLFSFDFIDQDTALESPDTLPTPAILRRQAKRKTLDRRVVNHFDSKTPSVRAGVFATQ